MCASATLFYFDTGRKDIQTVGGDAGNREEEEEEVKECKSLRVKAGAREGVGGCHEEKLAQGCGRKSGGKPPPSKRGVEKS